MPRSGTASVAALERWDKHLEHIYRTLGVSCRTAAIAAAYSALMESAVR